MFSKVAFLATASLAFFAAATPIPRDSGNTCSTGPIQCCNSIQSTDSAQAVKVISGLVGIATKVITGQISLTCTPVSVLTLSGKSCSAQTACCSGNNFNRLIVIGCSPINVGL